MAIIRESSNLTAGLGETLYTVPAGKQAVVSINVANAADTYIAIQTSDLANAPVSNSEGSFSNNLFNLFTNDVAYRTSGSLGYTIYRYKAPDNWVADNASYPTNNGHYYQIPLNSSFNYDAAVANFTSNDIDWRPNGAFDTTGSTRTGSNILNLYSAGGASIGNRGLSFQKNNGDYSQYRNLHTSVTRVTAASGHYFSLVSSQGWDPRNYCGNNLYNGTSTQYIYMGMQKPGEAPIVVMWDSGDILTSSSNTSSRGVQFTGITDGLYIVWIQESGGYTMIATQTANESGTSQLWICNDSAWTRGTANGIGSTATCTELTNSTWSSLSNAARYKPFVEGNAKKFYFRNTSTPYPFYYDADLDSWDTTGYPTALTYPTEIAGLEATLGDAYSFYKFGSSLNDYYIVAGSSRYTLIANYNSLDANSNLLNGLQNDSEKGGLTLKAGDKIIAYDKSSGGTVVQVYGYEEDV